MTPWCVCGVYSRWHMCVQGTGKRRHITHSYVFIFMAVYVKHVGGDTCEARRRRHVTDSFMLVYCYASVCGASRRWRTRKCGLRHYNYWKGRSRRNEVCRGDAYTFTYTCVFM